MAFAFHVRLAIIIGILIVAAIAENTQGGGLRLEYF